MAQEREVREMRDADTILTIIRERGGRGLPLEDVYRQLYNPALYLRAYGRIYRSDGAMTHGVTVETVDGMSLEKIQAIIESLKAERYRWTPVRRTYIEKKGSTKLRPLGIPIGRTSCCKRWSAPSWRRTTSHSSARPPTDSAPDSGATPP